MKSRRKTTWDRTAPTVATYAGYRLGQDVMVVRNTPGNRVSFCGHIIRICIPPMGWKFAVVQDGSGGTHACDFSELS